MYFCFNDTATTEIYTLSLHDALPIWIVARIVGHLSVAELEARYRAARDATEARHFQAIWLLARGRTVLEVSEVLAFVPRWVEELAARYNALGPEALGDRRRRNGRAATLLTEAVLAAL